MSESLPPPKSRKAYQGKRRSAGAEREGETERERERGAEESGGIPLDIFSAFFQNHRLSVNLINRNQKKVGDEAAGSVVEDGRTAEVDALPRGRHGRTPRPGAAYAGWHGGDGRRGKKAGHRRHFTANNDYHRPKLGRSTGEVRLLHLSHGRKRAETLVKSARGAIKCCGWSQREIITLRFIHKSASKWKQLRPLKVEEKVRNYSH